VLGTAGLLTPEERDLWLGFAINKFRGDTALFEEGVGILESRTGRPCFGVFPYADDIALDAEDGLAMSLQPSTAAPPGARIAIVRLPRLSNGTDFRQLTWADWVTSPPASAYDFVILPGTKSTIADLQWLRARGLDQWICGEHRRGATVIGVCGGFQMLGARIEDPLGVESSDTGIDGLGLLPVETIMASEKMTERRIATTRGGTRFPAYEIHVGATTALQPCEPFARLDDGQAEGVWRERVIGTYLHGALEDADVCAELFGVRPPSSLKRDQYDRLADWFERHGRGLSRLGLV
jgi:adenosylcobyric acid synthase